jgi:N-acetylglucosamine kinase-like BadF-type ATPase
MTTPGIGAYALDAGGSHTLVRIRRADGSERTWEEPSIAIAALGQAQAIHQLRRILEMVRSELAGATVLRGCIASSSYPVAAEAPAPEPLVRVIIGSGCTGRVMLVNDVVPLLWSDHLAGHGVIVNSGTGSSVIGRTRAGRLLKLGGHEHILSDQGSAYSMAREGLRAATRAADGLGSATTLLARAEAFYGRSAPSLGRWLAELGRARSEVARFAAEVLAADEEGLRRHRDPGGRGRSPEPGGASRGIQARAWQLSRHRVVRRGDVRQRKVPRARRGRHCPR